MQCPADVNTPSRRLDDLLHDRDVLVSACGRLCLPRKKINIPPVLAGHRLGIKEVDEGIGLVSFLLDDLDTRTSNRSPFNPSTTRSARGCHPCLRDSVSPICPGWTLG